MPASNFCIPVLTAGFQSHNAPRLLELSDDATSMALKS